MPVTVVSQDEIAVENRGAAPEALRSRIESLFHSRPSQGPSPIVPGHRSSDAPPQRVVVLIPPAAASRRSDALLIKRQIGPVRICEREIPTRRLANHRGGIDLTFASGSPLWQPITRRVEPLVRVTEITVRLMELAVVRRLISPRMSA